MTTVLHTLDTRDLRIRKEYQYIRTYTTKYDTISFNYIVNNLFIDIKSEKGNILHFNIPKNYPFKVPKLEIQTSNGSYNYKERLCNMPSSIYYFIKNSNHYFRQSTLSNSSKEDACLCCKSIFCEDNWSPAIMIYQILNEIENHNKIKQHIGYKLALNQYCKIKNIANDIIKPIIDFL